MSFVLFYWSLSVLQDAASAMPKNAPLLYWLDVPLCQVPTQYISRSSPTSSRQPTNFYFLRQWGTGGAGGLLTQKQQQQQQLLNGSSGGGSSGSGSGSGRSQSKCASSSQAFSLPYAEYWKGMSFR